MKKNTEHEGLFYYQDRQKAFVCSNPFNSGAIRFYVPLPLIRKYSLLAGARVKFISEHSNVNQIISINGRDPEKYLLKKQFEKLTVINPLQKFDLGKSSDVSMRIIDLIAPIALGSRALVISPPRAGKTVLLEKFAVFFSEIPALRTILLLVDERPEEITSFSRLTDSPVFSSSMDSDHTQHVKLTDLLLNNIRQEIESGNDVVVLIDSLTRLGRAHNLNDHRSGSKILSGGLGSSALQTPRKLFGLARNIEGGGSCTIIATILHETGSRMDDLIFQEFKGTGNCEILLDREISEMRVFPAIDIKQSGTRREELFRTQQEMDKINHLRRNLIANDKVTAMRKLLDLAELSSDNEKFIDQF